MDPGWSVAEAGCVDSRRPERCTPQVAGEPESSLNLTLKRRCEEES